MAGDTPRPPAPPRKGDQLWPTTAKPPLMAASTGRSRPASSGPTEPLATSHTPATARGPKPATRYRAVPETVPVPTPRRSTPRVLRAAMFENGTAPAAYAAARTTAGERQLGRGGLTWRRSGTRPPSGWTPGPEAGPPWPG